MKQKITSPILLLLPILLFGQMINNFDAEPEAGYWGYNISENADTILSIFAILCNNFTLIDQIISLLCNNFAFLLFNLYFQ